MAAQWSTLANDELTAERVHELLGQVQNDIWVISACVDRVLDDVTTQRALLTSGIARTDHIVEKCANIASLSIPSHGQASISNDEPLTRHFQSVPADAQLCHLRSVLLRRLDRLNTYVEMRKIQPDDQGMEVEDEIDEWEDDPWGDAATPSKSTAKSSLPESLPVSLSEFLQNDLLWSACELATTETLSSLSVLLQKHSQELWPSRFRILQCIPEHVHPSTWRSLLPTLDSSAEIEALPVPHPWRLDPDFSELLSTRDALNNCSVPLTEVTDSNKEVSSTAIPDPLSDEELSTWYKNRVNATMIATGMVDIALALVQHGAAQGIPSLDQLGEELSLLSRLVYDAPRGTDAEKDWTLTRWYSMEPLTVVRAYLAYSTPESLARDISHLVMPYLFVLEARAERAGQPDPSLPTRILYDYILTTSLENVSAIYEASKPTLPMARRIIKNDEDMARIALACLYGSNSLDEWATMSSIFECLPVWDVSDAGNGNEDAANTTVASLGEFVTPSTNQPQCTAKDLLIFFKPLPFASLSQALDILDVHLESGEILARWSVPAPLRWFLQSSSNLVEQRAWANRMARRAGGTEDRLNGIEDWEWLLKDMLKLTGGDSSAKGAFCLLGREEVMSIFLGGLLSTGNHAIAKTMIYAPRTKLALSPATIEDVCLTASRELYDNASSGNYKFGDMKLAYECLEVPPLSESIANEKEFIEATSRICSFNVPSSPGTLISPIEIRLTKDRLSLVSRVLSSNNDAYKHTEVVLGLCYKLGYRNQPVAEVKVLAMLADTALQAEDFVRAYENSERMVQTVYAMGNTSSLDGDCTFREAAEVCWIACFQLGRQPEFSDLSKKMTLLGHALDLCPPDKIHDVLMAWRKLETEDIEAREEHLRQRRSGEAPLSTASKIDAAPRNVASSLRARLQDFHMPSPPLLNTPDAAALASRTFKSVAANFPFGRGRSQASDMDERGSMRSESSRRTEGGDVSIQASRVLSKGIGWLIGADEDI
ncbi:hypothetical protein NLJ89_g1117 [Agrocybe chaxingu]|uniref:Sec39 domain-containing protein n=1 Tax=Agrocybe chaxingu TaxID=84603 RepID=A0A9W8TDZ9_9AGAR|nr:hypothetical protein NLJ89_g1117 [Agrocybe chaxingu]